ncbi:class I SAM-dependent methyltransferase [Pantanalinema sp. GBBB05]|uniref:class I SAM-dependent methyltransferase n=1 Tax=Pantanalinema sp. GBBB05 TaxID=2604139 RepID=UPI001DB61DD8|nr:methyltransferase domain-containing protein [Pantanalinema sp. GBBB05]
MKLPSVPVGIHTLIHEGLVQARLPFTCCINLWNQDRIQVIGTTDSSLSLVLQIQHPGIIRAVLLQRDLLVFVDTYLNGLFDFSGSLDSLILLFRHLASIQISANQQLRAWLEAWTLPALPSGELVTAQPYQVARSPKHDRASIQYHYDVGNDFYQHWLDPQLVYTCAHYDSADMSLAEAQTAKLDLICRKLRLQPGETLLDAGCGWGALLRWAVKHYGVTGYGITLSAEQVAFNHQQIEAEGMGDRLQVELRDYRELPQQPTFDKAVAIGIIEHIGRKNYPVYFNHIMSVLKPGGLFLNHGINATRDGHGNTIGERFINRYIFPNGELVRLSTTVTAMEDAGWEIVDVDAWRPHYAMTLRHWIANFDQAIAELAGLIGDRQVQLWRLYLIGSALAFEHNHTGLYQILLRKQSDRHWNLPLTRPGWLC